jgi:hypothetical protein
MLKPHRMWMTGSHRPGCGRQNKSSLIQSVSIMPYANRQSVETKRFTMTELYELRRVIIKHARSIPPGPARNEHRQIAHSMRSLFNDRAWLAVHTVTQGENVVTHEVRDGRTIAERMH